MEIELKKVTLNEQQVVVGASVNTVGSRCPLPIVKLKLAVEKVETNQVVEIIADDGAFPMDLERWCQETKHELLFFEQKVNGIFWGYVRKK